MIPDRTMLQKLALATEANMHAEGWDSMPPILGVVLFADVGWMSAPAPVQPALICDDLGDGLRQMASKMRKTRKDGVRLGELTRLGAMWLAYEGWVNTEVDQSVDARKLADIPGTKECRQVLLMDLAGHLVQAMRIRGQQPWAATMGPQRVPISLDCEGIVLGLRDLLLEHAVEMPEDEADIVALASWKACL